MLLCSEISARRKSQVGTGSRSEKIKTYNYKDTRMSGEAGPGSQLLPRAGVHCLVASTADAVVACCVSPCLPHNVYADHRSKVNYDLNKVMEGGIEESIQSLILLDQQEMLKELMEQ